MRNVLFQALSAAHAEMGNKLVSTASTETHPPLGVAMRKFGRAWHSLADLDQAQVGRVCLITMKFRSQVM